MEHFAYTCSNYIIINNKTGHVLHKSSLGEYFSSCMLLRSHRYKKKKHKCVLIYFLCDALIARSHENTCSQTSVSTCNIVGNVPYTHFRRFNHQEILPSQVVEICVYRSFLYTMNQYAPSCAFCLQLFSKCQLFRLFS